MRFLHKDGSERSIKLAAMARQTPPAKEREIGIDGGKPGPGRGKKTGANSHRLSASSSTSMARIISRLKRDRPDIAQRLEAGEFRSARAAAREAGAVPPLYEDLILSSPAFSG